MTGTSDAGEDARERSARLWLGLADRIAAGGADSPPLAESETTPSPATASGTTAGPPAGDRTPSADASGHGPAAGAGGHAGRADGHAAAPLPPAPPSGGMTHAGAASGLHLAHPGVLDQSGGGWMTTGFWGGVPPFAASPSSAPSLAAAAPASAATTNAAPAASAAASPPIPSGATAELAFISGITASGTVAGTSFWTWNNDKPATYASSSAASKWGSSTPGTSGGTVLYWFDASSNWTTTEKNGFISGLSLWSAEANIKFSLASSAQAANVTFVRGGTGAFTSAPGDSTNTGSSTEGTLGPTTITINTTVNGFGPIGGAFNRFAGYPYDTLVHEEGHMIGFGHGGPYNVGDGLGDVPSRQLGVYDSRLWTIMSYIDPTDSSATYFNQYPVKGTVWPYQPDPVDGGSWQPAPETPMILDILAAQRLYGAPTSGPLSSGGQVFGFNCNIPGSSTDSSIRRYFDFTINTAPIVTLWDAGTGNTLDLSGYSTTETIDLAPGTFSSCDGFTNNIAIAEGTVISTGIGGSGDDTLIGSGADDTLKGGSGNDTFLPGAGADTIDGGSGTNTVSYANSSSAVLIGLSGTAGSGGDAEGDTLTNIQNLTGSNYADTLVGDGNANTLLGGGGDDLLKGGGGADHLDGGAGNNTASYANSTQGVTVSLATGTGTGGEAQGDTLVNIQNLIGSGEDDTLTGDGNANDLSGGGGDDTLIGGGGADKLDGGAGTNTASYVNAPGTVVANLATGGSVGDAAGDTYTNIQNLTGSNYGDVLIGDANANTIMGGGGDDLMKGGGGADHFDGGSGNNTVSYLNSTSGVTVNLLLNTASGGDAQGNTFANVQNLTGSPEADILIGDGNANVLSGGDGDDLLKGGGGADTLDGGTGNNTASYYGSTLGVTVSLLTGKGLGGDAQGDTLTNIQNLTGSDQGDTLTGDANANILSGQGGDDLIYGEGGNDTIDGGNGYDTVVFALSSQSATITVGSSSTTVAGGGATATLTNVEQLDFTDIDIVYGALTVGSGSTIGDYEVAAGGTIEDDGLIQIGTTTPIVDAGTITGAGRLDVLAGANVTIKGASTYTGATAVAGTLLVGSGGSLAGTSVVQLTTSGAVFDVSGAGAALTVKSLIVPAGATVRLGTASLTVSGATTLSGGTVTGSSGGTLVTAGATALSGLILGGAAVWRNTGTVTATSGAQIGDASGSTARLANATGGTYNLGGDFGFTIGSNTASNLDNVGGTLAKTAGTGTSTVAACFVDDASTAAQIKIASGTLLFTGASNSFVAQAISGAGTFAIGGGTSTIGTGTTIATSIFSLSGGAAKVTVAATLSYAGTFTTASGTTLTLGSGVLTLSGTATVAGTVTGAGTLAVKGAMEVSGSVTGGSVLQLGTGGHLQFDTSQSGATVAFGAGSVNGVKVLGSATLADTIAGFAAGDTIDLAGTAYSAADESVFTASATGGTLKIVDTAHSNAVVGTFTLSGSYANGLFTLASDGSAGTTLGFVATPSLGLAAGNVETANIPGGSPLAIVDQFNADASLYREFKLTRQANGNYTYHYAGGSFFAGKSYAAFDNVVTAAGTLLTQTLYDSTGFAFQQTQYNANGSVYLQDTVSKLDNGNIDTHFAGGSFFTGKSFASFDNVTNASGLLLTQTLYDSTGFAFQQTQYNANGSVYLQDTVSKLANGNIDYHFASGSFFTGKSFASFDNVTNASGLLLTQTLFDSTGSTTQQTQFNANGSIYLQDTVSKPAAGQVLYHYDSGSFFSSKSYAAFDNLATTNNALLSQELYNNDGSHSFTVPGSNLTIAAAKADTFNVTGSNDTVRFNATGFGADLFKGYTSGDVFSFATSIFADYNTLSQHVTGTTSAVITDAANDTLTLNGVTPRSLTSGMFKFA